MSEKTSSARPGDYDFSSVKYVFLDRDGVINHKAPEGSYVTSWQGFEMLPGVERAIGWLNRTSRKVIVVTNQRAVALGRLSEPELQCMHRKLQKHLGAFGAHLDSIYYCPHDVGQCECRKPKTGLFERAFHDFPEARPDTSVMIGDSDSDVLAGANIGMKTILIKESPRPGSAIDRLATASARSLLEAVETYLH